VPELGERVAGRVFGSRFGRRRDVEVDVSVDPVDAAESGVLPHDPIAAWSKRDPSNHWGCG
jgi:hypothetical protein